MSLNETLTASPSPFLVKIAETPIPTEAWILIVLSVGALLSIMLYTIYMNKDDRATLKIIKMANNRYLIKYSFKKGESIGRKDNIRKIDLQLAILEILEGWE